MLKELCVVSILVCSALGERSSYLDRFTTEAPYRHGHSGSSYDRDREDSYSPNRLSSRRPSYATDRWGDVVSGGEHSHGRDHDRDYGYGTTPRSPYTRHTTDRWGHSGSSYDRTTSRYGDYDRESVYDLTTPRYGDHGSRYGTTSRYGSGGYGTTRWIDRAREQIEDSRADSYGSSSRDNYYRIQAHLVKLTNSRGLSADGSKCDTGSECDTQCFTKIDTETPRTAFLAPRSTRDWHRDFRLANNNNSPGPFSSLEYSTKDVCGKPFQEAVFRAYCEDVDTTSNELINNFDCRITRRPDSSESSATWHEGTCTPKVLPDRMSLTFRYKIFAVPRASCDSTSGY